MTPPSHPAAPRARVPLAVILLVICLTIAAGACRADAGAEEPDMVSPHAASGVRTLTIEAAERLLWRPAAPPVFAPTTAVEREALAALIPRLYAGARAASPPDLAAWSATAIAAGFRLEDWRVDGRRYWALVEAPDRRRGAGAYVFRVAPAGVRPEILLEAPHVYFDLGTDVIAAGMFFAPDESVALPRALFTNTIHRHALPGGGKLRRADSPADVAHDPDHGFSTATVAFATAAGPSVVIQLHGFARGDGDRGDRADRADRNSDDDEAGAPASARIVVSAGDAAGSSPRTTRIAAGLARAFGAGVARFPEDTDRLGATTNVQARALRRIPGAEFVHVELCPEFRDLLRRDPRRRRQLAAALFAEAS